MVYWFYQYTVFYTKKAEIVRPILGRWKNTWICNLPMVFFKVKTH